MGAGSSIVTGSDKRSRENRRRGMQKCVERFVVNVYATCPRKEAMLLILTTKRGRSAFKTFLTSEKAEEVLNLYDDLCSLQFEGLAHNKFFEDYSAIIKKYIADNAENEIMLARDLKLQMIELQLIKQFDDDNVEKINILLITALEQVVMIMARDQLCRFLQSKQYKTWRSAESSHAIAHTLEDAIGVDIKERGSQSDRLKKTKSVARRGSDSIRRSIRRNSFSIQKRDRSSFTIQNEFTAEAFLNVDHNAVDRILEDKSWLSCLVAAVEALPICFSLSLARKKRKTYPIIYTNNYFEKKMLFNSGDVLGKTISFLVGPSNDQEKTKLLSQSLSKGESVTAVLNMRRGDATMQKTIFAVKPIKNEKKIAVYIISLYEDVSNEQEASIEARISLLTDLLFMLPDTQIVDRDEAETSLFSCLPSLKV